MDELALVPMKDLASILGSSPRARKTTLSVVVSYYVISRIHPLSGALRFLYRIVKELGACFSSAFWLKSKNDFFGLARSPTSG